MNWLKKFMIGRYGVDQLSFAFLILFIIFNILTLIKPSPIISVIYVVLLFYFIFRILSRNIAARQKENYLFLRMWNPVQRYFKRLFTRMRDQKNYKYFKCSECKKEMRVPRGKGKIIVTCPRCGRRETRKS